MLFIFKKLPIGDNGCANIYSFIGHLGCFQAFTGISAAPGPGSMELAKVLLRGALQLLMCVLLCTVPSGVPAWVPVLAHLVQIT